MAKEFSKNVIGIEINEEFIYMSQIDEIEDTFTLTNCKQLNMPPRSINDGLLNDPDLIAEQILSSLEDSEFTASNVVISLNTNFFIKRTLITKLKENHELQLEVDNKCQFSTIFLNKDVQASFQKFSLETKKPSQDDDSETTEDTPSEKTNIILFYAGLSSELIDNIEDLTKTLDKNLVSIDLISLGILRALQWQSPPAKEPILLMSLDYEYIDINFVLNNNILLSKTLRLNSDNNDEELNLEAAVNSFKQFILEFSNLYPQLSLPQQCYYFSRTINNLFIAELTKAFSINFMEFNISSIIKYEVNESNNIKEDTINKFLPSIGLALKFYEPLNKTISLTKVKKQLAPIINQKLFLKNTIIFFAIIGLILIANTYIKSQINTLSEKITITKNQISIIQNSSKSGQKTQLGNLRNSIEYYENIQKNYDSKYTFFYDLISSLPKDITFLSLNYDEKNSISLKGEALYQDSIYTFYSNLETEYKNVKLSKIQSIFQDKTLINSFTISFELKNK